MNDYARIVEQVAMEAAEKYPNIGNKTLWRLIVRFIIRRYYDIAFTHYQEK